MMSFGDLSSNMLELSDSLKRADILLSYCGTLDRSVLQAILKIAKNRLAFINEKPETVKRVYNAINDTLENTIVHSNYKEDDNSVFMPLKNIFLITKNTHNYCVASGNFIKPEREASLKAVLEKVNSMSKDELKQAYQQVLSKGELSPFDTAEIGFIDMALKSDAKLEYTFNHKNGEIFFSLSITINN
jgi:NhaP-type Na+/H+ and K+/H+ antiporter